MIKTIRVWWHEFNATMYAFAYHLFGSSDLKSIAINHYKKVDKLKRG